MPYSPPENNSIPTDTQLLSASLTASKVDLLYKSMPISFGSSIIIAGVLACAHWNVVGKGEVIFWCLLLSGSLLARLVLWIIWQNTRQLYPNTLWLHLFRIGAWLTGGAWGSAAILLFVHGNPIYQALLAFSLAGVASGSITSLTSDKYTSLGFMILTIFPFSYVTYQTQVSTSIPMAILSLLYVFFVVSSSTRTRKNMEDQLIQNQNLRKLSYELKQKQCIEKIINSTQAIFIKEKNSRAALEHLLDETMNFSHHNLGFLIKICENEKHTPQLEPLIFSNKKKHPLIHQIKNQQLPPNNAYKSLESFFETILNTGQPLIAGDLKHKPHTEDKPHEHTPIDNFMGIPIFNETQKIAILGLANCSKEPTSQHTEKLQPLLKTITQFLLGDDQEVLHAQNKADLNANTMHTQAILNDIADGIITTDKNGIIQSFNYAAETMFGFKAEQIIGQSFNKLIPNQSSTQQILDNQLQNKPSTMIGVSREIEGLRRNGNIFLLDVMFSKVVRDNEPYFIGTLRDITDKKHIENQRNQFIKDIKRDIRSPLQALNESILQLSTAQQSPKEIQRLIGLSAKASVQLQDTMQHLFAQQQKNSTRLPLKIEKQPITPLVENCIKRSHLMGDVFQVTIKILNPEAHHHIKVDACYFDQALTHLLHRAIKRSNPRNEIKVVISNEQEKIKISIQTTSAIPPHHLTQTNETVHNQAEQEQLISAFDDMRAIIHFDTQDNEAFILLPLAS